MYQPFVLKLGGLCGAVALGPDSPLAIAGAGKRLAEWAQAAYRFRGKTRALRLVKAATPRALARLV